MTPGELIAKYIQLRDKKKELEDAHKERMAPFNSTMMKIEGLLQKHLADNDLDNLKCEAGTVYTAVRTTAKVDDWDNFLAFVQSTDSWHFLERRASKQAVEEYLESEQELPPGVSVKRDATVNIRRS